MPPLRHSQTVTAKHWLSFQLGRLLQNWHGSPERISSCTLRSAMLLVNNFTNDKWTNKINIFVCFYLERHLLFALADLIRVPQCEIKKNYRFTLFFYWSFEISLRNNYVFNKQVDFFAPRSFYKWLFKKAIPLDTTVKVELKQRF